MEVASLCKRYVPAVVAVVVMSLGVAPAAGALPGGRAQPVPAPPISVDEFSGAGQQCVQEAVERDLSAWVCSGDLLTTPEGTEALPVVPEPDLEAGPPTEPQARATGEFYDGDELDDTWCEPSNTSPCINEVSTYVSQAKNNLIYGNEDGVIGSFDWVVRLNLNGRSARFTVTLDYDDGPSLDFIRNDVACRENVPGFFDSSCGINYMGSPFTINSNIETFTYGPVQGSRIEDAGTYFVEGRMQFQPAGYDYIWTVPAPLSLNGPGPQSERFVCPTEDRNCYFNR